MITSLGLCITLFAVGVGLWATVEAIRSRPPGPVLLGAAMVLELACLAQGLGAVIDLVEGAELEERTVSLTYLLVSVGLIPAGTGLAKGDDSRWASAAVAVACLVLVVVNIRLHSTWNLA